MKKVYIPVSKTTRAKLKKELKKELKDVKANRRRRRRIKTYDDLIKSYVD